jgi:hypothetical protein
LALPAKGWGAGAAAADCFAGPAVTLPLANVPDAVVKDAANTADDIGIPKSPEADGSGLAKVMEADDANIPDGAGAGAAGLTRVVGAGDADTPEEAEADGAGFTRVNEADDAALALVPFAPGGDVKSNLTAGLAERSYGRIVSTQLCIWETGCHDW